jgi:hypothetical protein
MARTAITAKHTITQPSPMGVMPGGKHLDEREVGDPIGRSRRWWRPGPAPRWGRSRPGSASPWPRLWTSCKNSSTILTKPTTCRGLACTGCRSANSPAAQPPPSWPATMGPELERGLDIPPHRTGHYAAPPRRPRSSTQTEHPGQLTCFWPAHLRPVARIAVAHGQGHHPAAAGMSAIRQGISVSSFRW